MAQPTIKTSFASGEWAPKLRSRVDIQKYHAGAALLRNFYVDYSGGGASTRQGTKFIGQVGANGARLIPFQPSTTVSYVLEFGQNYIRFFSNGAQVLSAGNPYQISSPYAVADLFPNPVTGNPGLKFVQDVTSLIICHPSYPPYILTIVSATNWNLSAINFGTTIGTPTNLALTSTDGAGTTWYSAYLVTAIDANGQESAPPTAATFAGTNLLLSTAMSFTLSWTAVAGAASYNIYKATQSYKTPVPTGAQFGFIANVTGTSFLDSEPGIQADFSQTPPVVQNPFSGASVASYTVTVNGAYTTVPTVSVSGGGGSGATAQASLGVTIDAINSHGPGNNDIVVNIGAPSPQGSLLTFPNGVVLKITTATSTGGTGYTVNAVSIFSAGSITTGTTPSNPVAPTGCTATGLNFIGGGFNFNFTWGVTQVLDINNGEGYTSAPTVAFSAGAAAATAVLGAASDGNPGVPGFLQTRLWLAGQPQSVQTVNISQPDSFFNFNTSNPAQDDDAISATIIGEELNDVRSLTPVPTGMISFTGQGAWLLNGGGGISTMNPITPSNITAQPQAFVGANDLRPIKVNMDVLYGTNKGNYVRDLAYNLYAQIFTGSDISVLSNHLFFGFYLPDWTWSEEPFKTLWAIRNDGIMLSLGYVKEQELTGWAHHDTNGQFLSVCSVIETVNGNVVDAVYVIVQRLINGSLVQYVERMADRYFPYGYEDAWSVDCALQTAPQVSPTSTLTVTGDASTVGNSVTLTDSDTSFTAAMATNNWVVRVGGGIYKITAFTSTSIVSATVTRVPSVINPYTNVPYPVVGGWTIWQPVTNITGLTQLVGASVTGVADGAVVPLTTVSGGGGITLGTAATKVTLGLAYTPDLQTLPLDLGEPTVQGKRKKITALTLRVADTLGLQVGKTFSTLVSMKDFTIGNVPTTSSGVSSVTDLVNGDGRTIIDQEWESAGNYCVRQNQPYPATIIGVMPEVTVGDTK